MNAPFKISRMVEFKDTDMGGIMHFTSFFEHMEAAEHALLRSLGEGVYWTIDGVPVGFPRVSASCDYHAPVTCEDMLEIEVRVERVGEKSVSYEFRFTHDHRDVATGRMTSVFCRFESGRPPASTAIPSEFGDKLRSMIVQQ